MTNRIVGNRWYKCDFHLHTPASPCFEDKEVTAEKFIEQVIMQGIECIAITDHNSGAWIDEVKGEGEKKGIIVFPGVEITCSDSKVHLLVLFERSYTTAKVEDFLIKIGINRDSFGKENAYSQKEIMDIAKIVDDENAVIIPAHIDDYNGLMNVGHQRINEFFELQNINAIQMVKKELCFDLTDEERKFQLKDKYPNLPEENIKKYISLRNLVNNNNLGILTFSDNPYKEGASKHGLWGIGNYYSYIKMSTNPSLESLRQAFLFSKSRVKDCLKEENKLFLKKPSLWIEKINIKDIEILGDTELDVVFNPQLTTIIGGRGSGKSTIVRFLTAIFAKSKISELAEIFREFSEFYKIKADGVGVLKSSTEISIDIYKNQIHYKVVVNNFQNNGKYDVLIEKYKSGSNEKEKINEVEAENLFNVDIYNQKQIYELAKNTNSLRDKIDSLIEGIEEKKILAKNTLLEYKRKYIRNIELEEEIRNEQKIELDLVDIDEKINTYKSSEVDYLIKMHKKFENERVLINAKEDELDEKYKDLNNFLPTIKVINNNTIGIPTEIIPIIEDNIVEYTNIINEIEKMMGKIITLKDNYNTQIQKSDWNREYQKLKNDYSEKMKLLEDNNINVQEINKLLEQRSIKEKEKDSIQKKKSNLKKTKGELEALLIKYEQERREISNLREAYSKELLKETNIRIKVKKFRNMDDFIGGIRRILQKEKSHKEDILKIKDKCYMGEIEKNIVKLANDFTEIRTSGINNELYSGRFNNLIKSLNNEQMADINIFLPEDDIEIEYKASGNSQYKSLKNASAGQRTSAILTFILSDGDTPLILDQPEDDLDNHLIYELVVDRLKSCKEKRQIIVVTHNANIPVNGDAELIIAMDSDSKYIKVKKFGSIENVDLREEICNVMEGGKEAFKMRASRYKI